VVFVQECTSPRAPSTNLWTEGYSVRGETLDKGTAIATFVDGRYLNNSTGNHAAIYDGQSDAGIWVYDQWVSQGQVKRRFIRFKGGHGSPSNDGDAFSVIE
jgi:hypothetical protein